MIQQEAVRRSVGQKREEFQSSRTFVEQERRHDLARDDPVEHSLNVASPDRRSQREDRIKNSTENIDIRSLVDPVQFATGLLRRNIGRCADDQAVKRLETAAAGVNLRHRGRLVGSGFSPRPPFIFLANPQSMTSTSP